MSSLPDPCGARSEGPSTTAGDRSRSDAPTTTARRLLIIEDSEDDARLCLLAIRRAGLRFEHRRVQDMPTLVSAIADGPWDAIISDFAMPSFTGIEALRAVRASGIDAPFIFVSGTIGEVMAVEGIRAGANDYVMKSNLARLAPVLERELAQATLRAEHRRSASELRMYEAQLRHAQKLESIGTLAGGIAHDFNNLLGAIIANVGLVRDDLAALPKNHPAMQGLEEIQRASTRARDLVRQILTFSRHQPQRLASLELRTVIDETYRLLHATLPASVNLRTALPAAPVHVMGDGTQIQQVLMNLCTNAWHAIGEESGAITIGLEELHVDLAAARELGGLPAGSYARLWVTDTGCGMDHTTRERIFEPFFTTKAVGEGTGLGLSVVHGIVRSHGGVIRVDSAPNRGSTFHMYLPCAGLNAVEAVEAPVATGVREGRGERVLYIDDDETISVVAVRLLERAGYRATSCFDAGSAIRRLREDDQIDLVVTDLNMPDGSGLEIARTLAIIRPGLPVILSSGSVTDELRAVAAEAGVRGVLEKQNTLEDLCALVGHVLNQAAATPT